MVITLPVFENDSHNYNFIQKTYSTRLDCEVGLLKFIIENKPFPENQMVRCEKVDDIIGVLID